MFVEKKVYCCIVTWESFFFFKERLCMILYMYVVFDWFFHFITICFYFSCFVIYHLSIVFVISPYQVLYMRFFLSIYKGFPLWQFSFNFFKYLEELVVSFNYQTGLHTGAGQSFRIGCWYFFKKHMLYQTTDTNQNLICRYFSCYLFVNLWYFSHIFAVPELGDGLLFSCSLLCGGFKVVVVA